MMKARDVLIRIFLLGIFFMVLSEVLFRPLLPYGVAPNFSAILLVIMALQWQGGVAAALTSFLLGLQLDVATAQILGPWAAAYVACFYLLSIISSGVFINSGVTATLAVSAVCIFSQLISATLRYEVANFSWYFFSRILLEALLTAAITPLIIKRLSDFILGNGSSRSKY